MAGRQDFEARRRERLEKQRREREKRAKIIKCAAAGIGVLVLVILIINIAKCSGNKPTEPVVDNTNANIQATVAPTATAEPVVDSISNIPEPKQGENDFLTVLKNSGQKNRVYLTFDGTPNDSVTTKILDVLRRYDIKATFFISGESIESTPYLCTRILEEGHLVEPTSNASASVYDDKNDFIDEIDKTYQLICENSPSSASSPPPTPS